MIAFDNFLLKLKLFDGNSEIIDGLAVEVQYYNFKDRNWLTIFGATITGGDLTIEKSVGSANTEEASFFYLISSERLPPLRIIPRDPMGSGLVKQPVISNGFVFRLEDLDGIPTFVVDFGTMTMIPNDLVLDTSTDFEEILPVANYFPVTMNSSEPETPPVPIQDLYANLVSEIAAASDNNADSSYKLSNISVKLKALIHGEGESLSASLLNLENSENVNGDAISELVFDITPVHNRVEGGGISIPNLIGLTETAVRRVLKSIGLKLNPVYQKKDGVVHGDSFKQFPNQGVSIQPNELVTVIFSKHE